MSSASHHAEVLSWPQADAKKTLVDGCGLDFRVQGAACLAGDETMDSESFDFDGFLKLLQRRPWGGNVATAARHGEAWRGM